MQRAYSQGEIYSLLKNNPLNVAVHIGDLADMQGKDYIFLDYLFDNPIGYDNNGTYLTNMQISVATRNLETCKTLIKYIKSHFYGTITYTKSSEYDYFLAQMSIRLFLKEECPISI